MYTQPVCVSLFGADIVCNCELSEVAVFTEQRPV